MALHKEAKKLWKNCEVPLLVLIVTQSEWLNDARSSKEALKAGPEHAIVTGVEFSNEAPLERLQFHEFEKVRNQRPQ